MIFEILLTILLVGLTVFIRKWWRIIYLSMKIPGPTAYPIVGNALMFLSKQPPGNFLF